MPVILVLYSREMTVKANEGGSLDTFSKLVERLMALSFLYVCRSLHPSLRMELDSHWRDFDEMWYLSAFLKKSFSKIQTLLKSEKINWYFEQITVYIRYRMSLNSFSNAACFRKKIVEKMNTFRVQSFFFVSKIVTFMNWLTVSTFGCIPSVWFILADVSEPSVGSIFKGLKCHTPKSANS
jgi:hypothetical protein